ncbi:hypothetical protein P343_17900 [Sporolactobacillus laevolacticus DSM 442]|uniref:Uncharacterized protein n=1 Tax=Sporolactobacillus laevolacticus DSM 442 TaxID=1395513 RepID=V6ITT0_9BACL|nr:hypothetical protein P343_17900 [Sporolactobacillus laevolacticus DSM 442]
MNDFTGEALGSFLMRLSTCFFFHKKKSLVGSILGGKQFLYPLVSLLQASAQKLNKRYSCHARTLFLILIDINSRSIATIRMR